MLSSSWRVHQWLKSCGPLLFLVCSETVDQTQSPKLRSKHRLKISTTETFKILKNFHLYDLQLTHRGSCPWSWSTVWSGTSTKKDNTSSVFGFFSQCCLVQLLKHAFSATLVSGMTYLLICCHRRHVLLKNEHTRGWCLTLYPVIFTSHF